MYAIILEDHNWKIIDLLQAFDLRRMHITICRNIAAAKEFFQQSRSHPIQLFVDYELDPGCGYGTEFLEWVLKQEKTFIDNIVITTFSDQYAKVMLQMCKDAGVKALRYKP